MYSIGEISKIVNISVDALRYYDEIGLLKPCRIEQDNRYRYYSEEQINDILCIIEMKQYGFSLDAIKELLKCKDNDQLLNSFHIRLKQLNKETADIEQSIKSLKRRIAEIERKNINCMESKTVLIADDSAFMRKILKDILEKHNYTVVGEAVNGNDAIEKYLDLKPNLVIMDIYMSEELDGINAVKSIKSTDSNATIIMLSAKGFLPNVLKCIKAGANDFVVKPFQEEYLVEEIEKVIGKNRHFDANIIPALLSNNEFISKCPKSPASQKVINELLDICSNGGTLESQGVVEFINSL